MLPVTENSLVSRMRDRGATSGVPASLQTYVRTEYNGDGVEVRKMIAQSRRKAPRQGNGAQRGFFRYLFDVLEAAFTSPGGT